MTHPPVGSGGQELHDVVLARRGGVVQGGAAVAVEDEDVFGEGVEQRQQGGAAAGRGEVQQRLETVVPARGGMR